MTTKCHKQQAYSMKNRLFCTSRELA